MIKEHIDSPLGLNDRDAEILMKSVRFKNFIGKIFENM
ncbi:hypothetical protein IC006_0701 [Sulfuracidifex tepidarius]|uniref:Uncharacterized protein n=1 Tax=Sulfuracidifex tepidarius TaxID=1294262 RepID=A0A510E216_9CREN|nr:hypothetical protein IC006_0701 [Sulfuracidifex tepidarius]BBG26170.1 hypothetical protein IC007_0675 [Sulfuracidifex tepidarius]